MASIELVIAIINMQGNCLTPRARLDFKRCSFLNHKINALLRRIRRDKFKFKFY